MKSRLSLLRAAFFQVLIFIPLFFAVSIFVSPKADAALTLNCPGNPCAYPITPAELPSWVRNYLVNSDDKRLRNNKTPAYQVWLSSQSSYGNEVIDVPAGTTQLPVSFNMAGVVGWTQTNRHVSAAFIAPTSASNTNLPIGEAKGFFMGNTPGIYGSLQYSFNWAYPGGFNRSGDYTLEVSFKAINVLSKPVTINGRQYGVECVDDTSRLYANSNDWQAICRPVKRTVTVRVNVNPTLAVVKYSPDTHPDDGNFNNVAPEIRDMPINLYNKIGRADTQTADPFLRENINRDNAPFYIDFDIPGGWVLSRARINGVDVKDNNPLALLAACNQVVDGKARCKFDIDFTGLDKVRVVLWFDRTDSVGAITCTKEGSEFYWTGYGIDITNQASAPTVDLYEGSEIIQSVNGTVGGAETDQIRALNSSYPGASDTTYYNIKTPLNDKFRDGKLHTITAKLVVSQGDDKVIAENLQIGPGGNTDCNELPEYAFPWLQTKNGDVVASGEIIGNDYGDGKIGARNATPLSRDPDTTSEAEYLIMSVAGGRNVFSFCSAYDYILSYPEAFSPNSGGGSSGRCQNGSGYNLNPYDLNLGSNDAVVQSAKKAFNDLDTNCKGNNIASLQPYNPACQIGEIYSVTGNYSFGGASGIAKRATILVDGDLTITGNVAYATTPVPYNQLPSLAIIVSGKINIASEVTKIEALLYSADTINTCYAKFPANCKQRLEVFGSMIAKNGFYFQRTYFDRNGETKPAELITFSPNTLLNPPPGTDLFSYNSAQNINYSLDQGEYQPRF